MTQAGAKRRLIVATHNEGKLREIRQVLAERLGDEADRLDVVTAGALGLPDPVEDGVTFEENALIKARDVAQRTGCAALADDSGLIVDVMGRAPGILSSRWAGRHGDDAANNALLLAQLQDIPDGRRTARFVCCVALVVPAAVAADGAETAGYAGADVAGADVAGADVVAGMADGAGSDSFIERTVTGEMPGRIVREPHGANGFGYDPLFVPDDQPARVADFGRPLTSADLTPDEKNAISHRGKALRAIVPAIEALLL